MVRLNGPRWELELGGEGYPQSLVELQNPPEVLRGIGDREVLSGPCLAVIGARRATPYGIAAAELAGRVAAECGVTVVSGGAMGCDYAAGMAAAAAGGRTIVVAGTGADVPYPASSTPVFQAAVDSGAVVSLERWGQTPRRYAFPRRNAVVAALCKVLVITEAGQVSGTMSTADAALELGRTLYAIPGSIFSPNSSGTNRLAAEGARIIPDEASLELAISTVMGERRAPASGARSIQAMGRLLRGVLRQARRGSRRVPHGWKRRPARLCPPRVRPAHHLRGSRPPQARHLERPHVRPRAGPPPHHRH